MPIQVKIDKERVAGQHRNNDEAELDEEDTSEKSNIRDMDQPDKQPEEPSVSRRLRLSSDEIVTFQECVGFRWCAHKQQRLAAAAAYFRSNEHSRKQAQSIIEHIDDMTVRCWASLLLEFDWLLLTQYRSTPKGRGKEPGRS